MTTIIVKHWDRLARFGAEHIEAVLAAAGREHLVVDSAEADDPLRCVIGMILTSLCAPLYSWRAAANSAPSAVEAVTGGTR